MRTCSRSHDEIAYNAEACPMCALKESFADEAQKMEVLDRHLQDIGKQITTYLVRDPLVMAVKIKRSKKP